MKENKPNLPLAIAALLDVATSFLMKIYAVYLLIKGDFFNASIVMGMSAIYSISMVAAHFFKKDVYDQS